MISQLVHWLHTLLAFLSLRPAIDTAHRPPHGGAQTMARFPEAVLRDLPATSFFPVLNMTSIIEPEFFIDRENMTLHSPAVENPRPRQWRGAYPGCNPPITVERRKCKLPYIPGISLC
ncbi:hypothetical protein B0J13DRAFT_107501 [Dactylonectria estremocensis]|uniref:Secreted protein n=1 Tax=Dactylonectria estremocensis TaxID=1079267 RepID=A0A9P9E6P6_9HYPO|nr:hypothetical protein B0J13DRAFT_107501 [Dactylonectria estremocensis]